GPGGSAGEVQVPAVRREAARAAQERVRGGAGVAEEPAAGGSLTVAVLRRGGGASASGAGGAPRDAPAACTQAEPVSGRPAKPGADGGAGVRGAGRSPSAPAVRRPGAVATHVP